MNKLTWSASLVIVGVIAAGESACTITVNNNDDAGGSQGTSDSSGLDATAVDTGIQADAGKDGSADASTQGDTTSTVEAGSCPILQQITFGSQACDDCIASSPACCDATTACFTGAENLCADIAGCFADCLNGNPDAGVAPGTPASCKTDCQGPDASSSTFDAWYACLSNSCASQCLQ